jgi:hypothetical protein
MISWTIKTEKLPNTKAGVQESRTAGPQERRRAREQESTKAGV